ncbi:MAG TPA: sigma-70 family RNA polymerase sigma factor [Chthoniobacterales bacterium]
MQSSDHKDDAELIRKIATGDEEAFTTLYRRLGSALYGLACRMMNDAKEAEDVLQESFTYVWRRAGSFDPTRSSPFAWTVMIVRHKAIDKLRIRQRSEKLLEQVEQQRPLFDESDDWSALAPAVRERSAQVRAALADLSPEQRQALELAFFKGLTHEEVAAAIQVPLGTVKARIRRGLLKLKELVGL